MKKLSFYVISDHCRPREIEIAAKKWLQRIGCFSLVAGAASLIGGERDVWAMDRSTELPNRQTDPRRPPAARVGSGIYGRQRLLERQSSYRPFGQLNGPAQILTGADNCPGTIIPPGAYTTAAPFTDSGNTTGANSTVNEFGYYQAAYGRDHIYTFTLTSLGSNPKIEVSTTSADYNVSVYVLNGLTYLRCPAGADNYFWWYPHIAQDTAGAGATETITSNSMRNLPLNIPLHLFVDSAFSAGAGPYTVKIEDATIAETVPPPANDAPIDINGDGGTDLAIVRTAGEQLTWFTRTSGGQFPALQNWGITGDKPLAADFDGDGRDDIAVWRPGPQGRFYIIGSRTQTLHAADFGQTGDDPSVVADYNGDGVDEIAVYRPGATPGAQSYWFYRSLNSLPFVYTTVAWGQHGDRPVSGNFDGNEGADFVVQRAEGTSGRFFVRLSYGYQFGFLFGLANDMIVPGNYGSNAFYTKIALVRPEADGFLHWYIRPVWDAAYDHRTWGVAATDIPMPGDHDGDGLSELTVWRPGSPGTFFSKDLYTHATAARSWGESGDTPVASFRNH